PWLVLDLRYMAADIVLYLQLLPARHQEVIAIHAASDAEPFESHADRAKVLDASLGDTELRACHRGEPDQRADLDVVGADRVCRRGERCWSMDHHGVGADALDARAKGDQETGEILNMRFGRRV